MTNMSKSLTNFVLVSFKDGIRNFLHFFSDTPSRQIVACWALPKQWIRSKCCVQHGSLVLPTLDRIRFHFECMGLPSNHVRGYWRHQNTNRPILQIESG